MGAKEKVTSLKKYAEDLRARIQNRTIPPRRGRNPEEYLKFLALDLKRTEAAIERLIK